MKAKKNLTKANDSFKEFLKENLTSESTPEWINKIGEEIKVKNAQKLTEDEIKKSTDKKVDEIKKKLECDETIVKTIEKIDGPFCDYVGSVVDDMKKLKSNERIYTEKELKERLDNLSFMKDAMKDFNYYVNEEAKKFNNMTKKIQDIIEVDNDPNMFIKLMPFEEKERVMFKDKLLTSGLKKRPIYLTIGDYDFFYEYIDIDNQPVFSFNKKSFNFFFDDNIDNLRYYIGKNKCYFSGVGSRNDRLNKFSNLVVEVIDRKKKPVKKEEPKVVEPPKEEKLIAKKTYKVKFFNSDPLFVITDNPSIIFQKFNDEIDSIKVLGCGVEI